MVSPLLNICSGSLTNTPLHHPLLLPLLCQAQDGTLAIEEMDGGTFTVSNGGVFGSLFGTPIINPPQSAILGMHATVDRPVAVAGKVRPPDTCGVWSTQPVATPTTAL